MLPAERKENDLTEINGPEGKRLVDKVLTDKPNPGHVYLLGLCAKNKIERI